MWLSLSDNYTNCGVRRTPDPGTRIELSSRARRRVRTAGPRVRGSGSDLLAVELDIELTSQPLLLDRPGDQSHPDDADHDGHRELGGAGAAEGFHDGVDVGQHDQTAG